MQRSKPNPPHDPVQQSGVAIGSVWSRRWVDFVRLGVSFLFVMMMGWSAWGLELEEAEALFRTGEYEEVLDEAGAQVEAGSRIQGWHRVLMRTMLEVGRYEEAAGLAADLVERRTADVRTLITCFEVLKSTGRTAAARLALQRLSELVSRRYGFWEPSELVALGRAALEMGGEPRLVLEAFYDQAMAAEPDNRDVYLATAELALDKQDYGLAAEKLTAGLEKFGDDPRFHYLMAVAVQQSDREAMAAALDAAIHLNPKHADSWLLRAELAIDSEQYEMAETALAEVLSVNEKNPAAWALKSVIAHFRADPAAEDAAYEQARAVWMTNPEVDYLIGLKLSQHYRFREAVTHQQRALQFDPAHLGARMALGQDLLRLGRDDEGWALIEQVHQADEYQVTAYNLVSLMDRVDQFESIRTDRFILRMSKKDAELYGDEALGLLNDAWDTLTEKYGIDLRGPIVVELYANQQDFAVRTFGVPGGFGYLGVCFGRVITANAPGYPAAGDANWQAVLWHEFTHVITLGLTNNKMPRWFSEGISVYEELAKNPAWGQRMTAEYRKMLEEDGVHPISDLSGMFLSPKTPGHIMLAYYQSALAIEFIVEKYGVSAMRSVLGDMGAGVPTNEAIARNTASMEILEPAYEAFVLEKMEALGPDADWTVPEVGELEGEELNETWFADYLGDHPNSIWALRQRAGLLIEAERYADAIEPLERLIELHGGYADNDGDYVMLSRVYRAVGREEDEKAVLEQLAAASSRAMGAYRRLIEIGTEDGDWGSIAVNAERMLAVNPLEAQTYSYLARAEEELGDLGRAAWGYERVLMLEPIDPAGSHFKLAQLLRGVDREAAQRHVLLALAEAPRYRAAHRLLLELNRSAAAEEEARRAGEAAAAAAAEKAEEMRDARDAAEAAGELESGDGDQSEEGEGDEIEDAARPVNEPAEASEPIYIP